MLEGNSMDFSLLQLSIQDQHPPPAAACYSSKRRGRRANADKENLTISHKNSALIMVDDDKDLVPHGSRGIIMDPPRWSRSDSSSSDSSDDEPPKLGLGGEGFGSASHDWPPQLSFKSFASHNNATAAVRRPVALRPSTMEPSKPPAPALRLGAFPKARTSRQGRPFPSLDMVHNPRQDHGSLNVPQLSIRPARPATIAKKELKLSSPLARRGASERAYLQGQVRAEAIRRRKQEIHNEQRKLRENANTATSLVSFEDVDTSDGDVLSLIEKFKFGFGDNGHPNDGDVHLKFIPKKKGSHQDLRESASSPPLILKKAFKRSVSAVLDDSGINEDGNLLFFPDGVPLLRDDEDGSSHVLNEVASQGSAQEKSSLADERSVEASESGSLSQESPSSENESSPSLIAADVIWQIGAISCDDVPGVLSMPTYKANKKVTLRPKMNAPKHNVTSENAAHPPRQFNPINGLKNSDSFSLGSDAQSKHVGQANSCARQDGLGGKVEYQPFEFASPDKFYPSNDDMLGASESYQQLSFENEDKSEGTYHVGCNTHEDINGSKDSFVFASPEAGFNFQTSKGRTPNGFVLRDPNLSESNFRTPDYSSSRKSIKGKASMALDATIEEGNVLTGIGGALLKPPVSEANYRYSTPDNSEHKRSTRRQLPAMPKLPELSMPDMLFDGKAALAVDATVEEKGIFSPGISTNGLLLNEPLSESNYCTPDNSYSERTSFLGRQLGVQMPELPILVGQRQAQNEDTSPQTMWGQANNAPSDGEGIELELHQAMKTPC